MGTKGKNSVTPEEQQDWPGWNSYEEEMGDKHRELLPSAKFWFYYFGNEG